MPEQISQDVINQLRAAHGNLSETQAIISSVNVAGVQYIPLVELEASLDSMSTTIVVNGQPPEKTIVYSGFINEANGYHSDELLQQLQTDNPGFKGIGSTDAMRLLNSNTFGRAHEVATQSTTGVPISKDALWGETLPDGTRVTGKVDQISTRFSENIVGDIITITPHSDVNRVFVQSELEHFINNTSVSTINGYDRLDFKSYYDDLIHQGIDATSALHALDQQVVRASSIAYNHSVDPTFLTKLGGYTADKFDSLAKGAKWLGTKVVDSVPLLGTGLTFLGFMSAADDAHAAYDSGDNVTAVETMTSWLGEEIASNAAFGVGWTASSTLTAPMNLTGPWGVVAAQTTNLLSGLASAIGASEATKASVSSLADFARNNMAEIEQISKDFASEVRLIYSENSIDTAYMALPEPLRENGYQLYQSLSGMVSRVSDVYEDTFGTDALDDLSGFIAGTFGTYTTSQGEDFIQTQHIELCPLVDPSVPEYATGYGLENAVMDDTDFLVLEGGDVSYNSAADKAANGGVAQYSLTRGDIGAMMESVGQELDPSDSLAVTQTPNGLSVSVIRNDATKTIDGKTYELTDIGDGLYNASEAVAEFIQQQVDYSTQWFTGENGARVAALQWLSQNAFDLANGDLDPGDAFVSFAQFMGAQYLNPVLLNAINSGLGTAQEKANEVIFNVFVENSGEVVVSAQTTQAAQTFANNVANVFADFATEALIYGSGNWNSDDYANAALMSITSELARVNMARFLPPSGFSAGVTQGILTVAGNLFEDSSLNTDEYIQLGVQAGVAVGASLAATAIGGYAAGGVVWGGTSAAFAANSAIYSTLGIGSTGQAALGALGGPVGIVVASVVSFIAGKILFGSGPKYYEGEFPTREGLINSLYQIVDTDENGDPLTDADGNEIEILVAVHKDGTTAILMEGITHAQGGTGHDTLVGNDDADDVISGGEGSDYLEGKTGNDTLFGQDGHDHIVGGEGDDIIVGAAGHDELFGDQGADTILGDDGDDFIHAGAGADAVGGGDGADIILGGLDGDVIEGGDGGDIIEAGHGDDFAAGDAGDDYLFGNLGNDNLEGGEGNDALIGEMGNDQLAGGSGNDFLDGSDGVDILSGDNGDDILLGGVDDDALDGGLGDDRLDGGLGNDVLIGGLDDDLLRGDIGDDDLQGGLGADILIAGVGTDTLDGGGGDDLYVFGTDHGVNTIAADADGSDRIILDGFASGAVTFAEDGNNLLINYGAGGDQVRVAGQLSAPVIETLDLSDGQIDLTALTFAGGVPSFSVIANPSPALTDVSAALSTFDADVSYKQQELGSNNLLSIIGLQTWHEAMQSQIENTYYNGSEIAVYHRRSGLFGSKYRIYAVRKDPLLQGEDELISYTELQAGDDTSPYDAVIGATKVTYDNRYFTVEDIWVGDDIAATTIIYRGQRIATQEGRVFGDYNGNGSGGLITAAQRMTAGVNDAIQLGEIVEQTGVDKFVGSYWDETINGNSGDDYLFAGEGNDNISGGDGSDWMFGGGGNDIAYGGNGDDLILGGIGKDTLYGGDGDDALLGGEGNDTLYGEAGEDYLDGGPGYDTLVGGDGEDVANGGASYDWADYSSAANAVVVDLAARTATGNGDDILINIDRVKGSAYNDTLIGSDLYNILNGSTGADYMAGGGRTDYYYVDNPGDVIVEYAGGGTDRVYTYLDNYVLPEHFEQVATMGDISTMYGNDVDNRLYATHGDYNTTLYGGEGDDQYYIDSAYDLVMEVADGGTDTVYVDCGYALPSQVENLNATSDAGLGLSGNMMDNIMTGHAGADILNGWQGNDTLHGMDGNDMITDYSGHDTIYGGDGDDALYGGFDNDTIYGEAGNDTIYGQYGINTLDGGMGDDHIQGSNDVDIMIGGDGDDYLQGNGGNDTMSGGAGTDTLWGFTGADTFVFEAATAYTGIDTISLFSTLENDSLDISDLLTAYDPLTNALTDFVRFETVAGNKTSVSVDADGLGGALTFQQIAELTGISGITDEGALVTSGHLIV